MQYLTIWDLILTPAYLLVLSIIAKRYRDKKYSPKHPLRKYYMPGLWVKFGGAIFIALIYQFYYREGDTYNFYEHSLTINSALGDSFSIWTDLLLHKSYESTPQLYPYISALPFYNDTPSYSVAVVGAVFGLLNGTTYLPIALLFAFFSYTGIWALYRTFVSLYPRLHKELAVAILFIPSTFVWGSAVFKDTICIFGLGWLTYCTFQIFVNRNFGIKNLLMLCLSFYLIAIIKVYILLAFMPALIFWLLITHSKKIKSIGLRFLVNLFFVTATIVSVLFLYQQFSGELNRYSFEKIAQTAQATRGWIYNASGDEGSAYSLGAFDPSFSGMLQKFPQAVVVTLFRPFVWEAGKAIVLLSSAEALIFLVLTIYVLIKRRLKIFSVIAKDPNLMFCLVFSLIFAFAVGITSYNFGALSRYKIPCLPFYGAFLAILIYRGEKNVTAGLTNRKK